MEYDDFKNDSDSLDQVFEEYEVYEDRFDPAVREKAVSWDGQVEFCCVLSQVKWSVNS